jgi:hypothetical protein
VIDGWGAPRTVGAMLHPDRREAERQERLSELKVIACLSVSLALAVVFVGTVLMTCLLGPIQAYPLQW